MNTSLRHFALTLAALFTALCAVAQGVTLRSGKLYEIRCMEILGGAVVPATADPLALEHTSQKSNNALWRITKLENGNYTIQHAETSLYMTYDGMRTTTRRYMHLTEEKEGTASEWYIYPGDTHIIIVNVRSHYLLNLRRDSHIVGLYNNTSTKATGNERFLLIDAQGKPVTSIEGKAVVFSSVATPSAHRSPLTVNLSSLTFSLDGKTPVYDALKKRHLYTLSEKLMGKEVQLKLSYENPFGTSDGAPQTSLFVDGKQVPKGGKFSFGKVTGARTYRLAWVANGDTIARTALQFTYMPIIEITASKFGNTQWGDGTIIVHDADVKSDSTYLMQVRNRGDFTSRYSKRSMGIKLKGANGKKINRTLLNLRTDNYWVLDAMSVDYARMRNRVAMDLWNDFAEPPYFFKYVRDAHHASRGRLVEVILNGKYHGIYNLCERIDRKQLQLAKGNDIAPGGMLYRTDQWSGATQFLYRKEVYTHSYNPSPKLEDWRGWQAKYPEPSAKKDAKWAPLIDALKFVSDADDATFSAQVATYFDLPALRDYYLLIELIFATDNSAKNMFWAIQDYQRDRRMSPLPWDMDGTFGRNYAGSNLMRHAATSYRDFLRSDGHQNGLYERLYRLNPHNWNAQMAQRYRTLRRTHFNPSNLTRRFTAYLHLMQQSGADTREAERWNNTNGMRINIPQEAEFIKAWITRRIAYLDKQYKL